MVIPLAGMNKCSEPDAVPVRPHHPVSSVIHYVRTYLAYLPDISYPLIFETTKAPFFVFYFILLGFEIAPTVALVYEWILSFKD